MKWICYQIVQSIIGEEKILANKKVGHNEANLAIAQAEAYNGEYTIEEDEQVFDKEPLDIEFGGTGADNATKACENLGAVAKPKRITGTLDVTVTFEDNTEYKFDGVRILTMTFPSNDEGKSNGISFHGFVTFSTYMPVVTATNTPLYVKGDDINNAAPGETWEFSYHSGHMVWVNWG